MSKLVFFFSTMNSGKTTHLLQTNHNFSKAGRQTFLFKPKMDTRDKFLKSRLGIEHKCDLVDSDDPNYFLYRAKGMGGSVFLVDEAQFFSKEVIRALAYLVDHYNIDVYCYGLRSSVTGELFEGSQELFVLADKLVQLSNIATDGRKAIMHIKKDKDGNRIPTKDLQAVEVGDMDIYESVSRKQWFEDLELYQENNNE